MIIYEKCKFCGEVMECDTDKGQFLKNFEHYVCRSCQSTLTIILKKEVWVEVK